MVSWRGSLYGQGGLDMDFLESSAVMVPALTGMVLTLYDGNPDVLSEFEHKY